MLVIKTPTKYVRLRMKNPNIDGLKAGFEMISNSIRYDPYTENFSFKSYTLNAN